MPKHPPASTIDDGSSDDWWNSLTAEQRDQLFAFEQAYRRAHHGLLYFDHRLSRARRRQLSNHTRKGQPT